MQPILNPAPSWQPDVSDYSVLWHGCTEVDKDNIEKHSIDLARCRVDVDFGRGFYTTSLERQARHWAWQRFSKWKADVRNLGIANRPVVLRFRVPRYGVPGRGRGLDELNSLHFVLGNYDNDDYWSFVQHCRQSVPADPLTARAALVRDHARPPHGWYDLVSGPVAASWEQRLALQDADQVSFHTDAAVTILNDVIQRGQNGSSLEYGWIAF